MYCEDAVRLRSQQAALAHCATSPAPAPPLRVIESSTVLAPPPLAEGVLWEAKAEPPSNRHSFFMSGSATISLMSVRLPLLLVVALLSLRTSAAQHRLYYVSACFLEPDEPVSVSGGLANKSCNDESAAYELCQSLILDI